MSLYLLSSTAAVGNGISLLVATTSNCNTPRVRFISGNIRTFDNNLNVALHTFNNNLAYFNPLMFTGISSSAG